MRGVLGEGTGSQWGALGPGWGDRVSVGLCGVLGVQTHLLLPVTTRFGSLAWAGCEAGGRGAGLVLRIERRRDVGLSGCAKEPPAARGMFLSLAAELEVPDTPGARSFFSFWSVLAASWLNGLFILTGCHPAGLSFCK